MQAETTKAQARELRALLDVAGALTSTLEPDQVFEHVVEGIRAVIHCEDAIIYSYDEGAGALQMVTGLGARLDRPSTATTLWPGRSLVQDGATRLCRSPPGRCAWVRATRFSSSTAAMRRDVPATARRCARGTRERSR